MRMWPEVGVESAAIALRRVVFPHPDGPITAMHSLGPSVPETLSRISLVGGSFSPLTGLSLTLTVTCEKVSWEARPRDSEEAEPIPRATRQPGVSGYTTTRLRLEWYVC